MFDNACLHLNNSVNWRTPIRIFDSPMDYLSEQSELWGQMVKTEGGEVHRNRRNPTVHTYTHQDYSCKN